MILTANFGLGDRVIAHSERDIVMVIDEIRFTRPNETPAYGVSWFSHGDRKLAQFNEWELATDE